MIKNFFCAHTHFFQQPDKLLALACAQTLKQAPFSRPRHGYDILVDALACGRQMQQARTPVSLVHNTLDQTPFHQVFDGPRHGDLVHRRDVRKILRSDRSPLAQDRQRAPLPDRQAETGPVGACDHATYAVGRHRQAVRKVFGKTKRGGLFGHAYTNHTAWLVDKPFRVSTDTPLTGYVSTMTDLIDLPAPVRLAIADDDRCFPVGRIFCIGRNYAAHAAEMGSAPEPIFFMKPGSAATQATEINYPNQTEDLHHEIELVLALGENGEIVACGAGVDLTRRDLQARMKQKGAPWEIGKGFDNSALLAPLTTGPAPGKGFITLTVNGELRQSGQLQDMILPPDEMISALSQYFELQPGDLIFTGTPAGVGPLQPGDLVEGEVEGLPKLRFQIKERAQ